jgi:hypothetical protein
VGVGRQDVDERCDPGGPAAALGEDVVVVEHEADLGRGALPDGGGDRLGSTDSGSASVPVRAPSVPAAPAAGPSSAPATPRGEAVGVAVAGLEPEPHVGAPGREPVLGHGLDQQRRLSQARAADDQRDPVLPAAEQGPQQTGSDEQVGPGLGRIEPKRTRHPGPRPSALSRLVRAEYRAFSPPLAAFRARCPT